jgi:uncharacterized OB-fold protein
MSQVPIAEGIFTGSEAKPRLLGSRCTACGAYTFPAQDGCPRCAATDMEHVELASEGTIWTWTSQEFLPPSPPYAGPESAETFQPYYIGFVELEGELRVESRLVGFADGPPQIGQRVETVVMPYGADDEGHDVMTYAFAPTKGELP